MRRAPMAPLVVLSLIMTVSAASVRAGESLTGAFRVNNQLPAGWNLQVTLRTADGAQVVATETAQVDGTTIPFSFADVGAGSYRARLSATDDGTTLELSETPVLTVGGDDATADSASWQAIGAGGTLSGEIELAGDPPAERMILVRARRIDIDLEGQFPDQLNAFTVEVQEDEFETGRVAFEFAGLSYGLYAVELIAYHYKTHTTQPIAAHPQHVVVDLDHQEYSEIDFTVEFAAAD